MIYALNLLLIKWCPKSLWGWEERRNLDDFAAELDEEWGEDDGEFEGNDDGNNTNGDDDGNQEDEEEFIRNILSALASLDDGGEQQQQQQQQQQLNIDERQLQGLKPRQQKRLKKDVLFLSFLN